jgi:2-isopropylmalate synthase
MLLKMPSGAKPRHKDFQLKGLLDETLREGAERCPFPVDPSQKIELARDILRTGVSDLVFGSGPDDPDTIARLIEKVNASNDVPREGWSAAFILLLNCWEPMFERFRSFPRELMPNLVVSFGMVDHRSDEALFERVCDRFRSIGVERFRVSLLNSFGSEGVEEEKYAHISRQIDRSLAQGIGTVRINDSLGEIYPEAMAVLAANLVADYPTVDFCLHAHDDKGLGLQNALVSIYHGFSLVEAAFSGFGNRSGLPAIELMDSIFREKRITIENVALDSKLLTEVAHKAERSFYVVPHVYRPVSGRIVNWENLGVANIPDYLGSDRDARKFLNDVGLHEKTVEKIILDGLGGREPIDLEGYISPVANALRLKMEQRARGVRDRYDGIVAEIERLYTEDVFFEDVAVRYADDILSERA